MTGDWLLTVDCPLVEGAVLNLSFHAGGVAGVSVATRGSNRIAVGSPWAHVTAQAGHVAAAGAHVLTTSVQQAP